MAIKIELILHGLEYGKTSAGAYLLLLKEKEGRRRMPIVIGGPEAQAIAVVLENMKPQRPFTHDTFKNVLDVFHLRLKEVLVYNLVDGIFYAKLIVTDGITEHEIDSRSSDAIAMAVRYEAPIYVYNFILDKASMPIEPIDDEFIEEEVEEISTENDLSKMSLNDLNDKLNKALETEDYESASKFRDEINRRG
ncbi:MAG: bifunctional nuclease domain-containing protein [Salibacteraceae bacterium]